MKRNKPNKRTKRTSVKTNTPSRPPPPILPPYRLLPYPPAGIVGPHVLDIVPKPNTKSYDKLIGQGRAPLPARPSPRGKGVAWDPPASLWAAATTHHSATTQDAWLQRPTRKFLPILVFVDPPARPWPVTSWLGGPAWPRQWGPRGTWGTSRWRSRTRWGARPPPMGVGRPRGTPGPGPSPPMRGGVRGGGRSDPWIPPPWGLGGDHRNGLLPGRSVMPSKWG